MVEDLKINKDILSRDDIVNTISSKGNEYRINVMGPATPQEEKLSKIVDQIDAMESQSRPQTKAFMLKEARQILEVIKSEITYPNVQTREVIDLLERKVDELESMQDLKS